MIVLLPLTVINQDGQPLIEGKLKEKQVRWKFIKRWKTRYFTLAGNQLLFQKGKSVSPSAIFYTCVFKALIFANLIGILSGVKWPIIFPSPFYSFTVSFYYTCLFDCSVHSYISWFTVLLSLLWKGFFVNLSFRRWTTEGLPRNLDLNIVHSVSLWITYINMWLWLWFLLWLKAIFGRGDLRKGNSRQGRRRKGWFILSTFYVVNQTQFFGGKILLSFI